MFVPERSHLSNRTAEQHAFVADAAERLEVVGLADDGRVVDLVIAGMDDRPDRRMDRERKTIDQRMRRVNELDLESADLDDVVGLDPMQQHVVEHVELLEPLFREGQRESRRIDRQVEIS